MFLTRWIVRRWKAIVVIGLASTLLGIWPASQLKLETDLAALLPVGSDAADDYRAFFQEFGALERVFVVVVSRNRDSTDPDSEIVTDAAEELAAFLEKSPEVAVARSGLEPDDEEFIFEYVLPRAPLLAGDGWQEPLEKATAPGALRERAEAIRNSVLSPFGQLHRKLVAADPLGLAVGLPFLRPGASELPVDPLGMGFLSADGYASLVVVTPARAEMDPEGGRALARELNSAFEAVRETLGDRFIFAAVGGPLYAAHDEQALRKDLQYTLVAAAIGCALLLVIVFGSFLIPLGAVLAMSAGIVATFVLLRFGIGSVSSIGVGFAAILVGLGIDYIIHGSVRYCQSRRRGNAAPLALEATFLGAGPAILTSAMTTAAAFAVLIAAHLRPIRELGVVVSVGILAILFATAILGGAILVALDRASRAPTYSGLVWRLLGRTVDASVRVATRHSGAVIFIAVLLTLVAAGGLTRFRLQPDFNSLRPSDHPTVVAEALLLRHFSVGLDTTTIIVEGVNLGEALDRAARVESLLRTSLEARADITSPTMWLGSPRVIGTRLETLKALPLEPAIREFERQLDEAGLNVTGLAPGLNALRSLDRGKDPGFPPLEAWPHWLAELVRIKGDQVQVAVRLRLPQDVWPEGPPAAVRRRLVDEVPGVVVASVPAVGRELKQLARNDLDRLAVGSILAVIVVVFLAFRGRSRDAVLSLTPVTLGTLWVLGLWSLCGYTLDIFGVAVLPIMLGIGVDDGLHAVHGANRTSGGRIVASVSESGRAMILTTLTTCIGFGSLAFSHLPGLRQGGILISFGVLACLAATLVVLPAFEAQQSKNS
jgi:predicted RND superfamily exporter protein